MLHHTGDTFRAFTQILKYLKKDGYIILGLYNKIGRFRTNIRRFLFKFFGKKIIHILDPVVRELKKEKKLIKIKSMHGYKINMNIL